jgi:hypothetical protein
MRRRWLQKNWDRLQVVLLVVLLSVILSIQF